MNANTKFWLQLLAPLVAVGVGVFVAVQVHSKELSHLRTDVDEIKTAVTAHVEHPRWHGVVSERVTAVEANQKTLLANGRELNGKLDQLRDLILSMRQPAPGPPSTQKPPQPPEPMQTRIRREQDRAKDVIEELIEEMKRRKDAEGENAND